MVSIEDFVAFAVVAIVIVAIPGPSVLFTISRALTMGRRVALLNVVGNAAGVYLQVVAVVFGVGAVVQRSAIALPTELVAPHGAFLVARLDGVPAGCGAVRRLDAPRPRSSACGSIQIGEDPGSDGSCWGRWKQPLLALAADGCVSTRAPT